jgi:hypothetical protein
MTKKRWALIAFIALGIVKIPVEDHVSQRLLDDKLRDPPPEVGVWDQVPQVLIAASLGGLRSLAASIAYLFAWEAWDRTDWGSVDSLMRITTILEPQEPMYWEEASWQMAYNAASNAIHEGKVGFVEIAISKNPVATLRYQNYIKRGTEILEEGLKYLPHNHRLLEDLGNLYKDRALNPRGAAECYLDAFKHGSKEYFERMAAYEMVKIPDDRAAWERAYDIMKRAYYSGKGVPSVVRDLPILEERLGIPKSQRIDPKAPVPTGAPRILMHPPANGKN